MRIVEPVLMASLALAAPAGFVGAAYMGPNFISADFNGFAIPSPNPTAGPDATAVKKAKPKKPALPPDGPGLRGATMPHCSPGQYTAGYECKLSPPNHYVPVGAIYPILCPPGTYAPVGSQSKGQCIKRETDDGLWAQGKAIVKTAVSKVKIPL